MPDHPERTIALDAADMAFADTVRHLIEQLHLGIGDSHGDTAAPVSRFEAGLSRALQARQLATASIARLIA